MRKSALLAVLTALLVSTLPSHAGETAKKRNVLFLSVDDLRPALACAGDRYAKTPNIDRLARRGTVFTRAYCQQAVCSPSRTSLLTGRRPDSTKVYDLVTHFRDTIPDVVTLPQHFRLNGYFVRGIGKIYHSGYNDKLSWSVPWENVKAPNFGPVGQALLQKLIAEAKSKKADASKIRGLPFEAPDVGDTKLKDGAAASMAIDALKECKAKGEPFFLAVGFARPHLPFVAPKKYWDLYDPNTLPVADSNAPPKNAPGFALQAGGELRAYHGVPKTGPIPKDMARQLVHGYYASVSYMDAQVGRLLDALDELGLADDTIIILWGDHGWHLGDHGIWCKHTNYELATRSALVLHAPGQKSPGRSSSGLVEFVDIYPTLTELCRLPKAAGVEGLSFAPLLDDPNRPWKTAAFSQYPRSQKGTGAMMGYALRTSKYRYVEWRKKTDGDVVARELYDHDVDPNEDVNIAEVPAHRDTIERLARQLAAGWKASVPPQE